MSEGGIQVGVARTRAGAITGEWRAPAATAIDEAAVRSALTEVMDPELPMLSVVDLGIIHRVGIAPNDGPITVEILPTFVGCPALELIKASIADAARRIRSPGRGHRHVRGAVELRADQPGRSCRPARRRHRAAGPAAAGNAPTLIDLEPRVPCPHCGSRRTTVENLFGPTQCRTIRYCADCRQPFESIKPV